MITQDVFTKEMINIPLSTSVNNSNNTESHLNLLEDKLARLSPHQEQGPCQSCLLPQKRV